MSIKQYLNERFIFLLINFILFIIVSGIMLLINISSPLIVIIFCVWFFPILTYFIFEYVKQNNFYNELNSTMEHLDKKYLLPEVMTEPEYIEGKLVYDLLRQANKDMHEQVKAYRESVSEYREYIETWVHEIKTPIASTRLIIENNQNDVTRNIKDEVRKVEEYIEQVLYYTRSNNVSKDFIIKEVCLIELVRSVIKRNARDFISKEISINIEAVEGTVYSDVKWLEFIVNQLIGNAIKYSREHNGKVIIKSHRNEHNILLTIEDNGIGIIEKDINRVFEKGFTGENGRKHGRSTGIGLYLCKKLTEQLGLGLEISSKTEAGTKVSITFPLSRLNINE